MNGEDRVLKEEKEDMVTVCLFVSKGSDAVK